MPDSPPNTPRAKDVTSCPSADTCPMPVTTTRCAGMDGRASGSRALERFDGVADVANGLELAHAVVGDDHAEPLFDVEGQFQRAKRIEPEFGETAVFGDPVFGNLQLRGDHLFDDAAGVLHR